MFLISVDFPDQDNTTIYTIDSNGTTTTETYDTETSVGELRKIANANSNVFFVNDNATLWLSEHNFSPLLDEQTYYRAVMRSLTAKEHDVVREFDLDIKKGLQGPERTLHVLYQLNICLKRRNYGYMAYNKFCNYLWIAGIQLRTGCVKLRDIAAVQYKKCKSSRFTKKTR